MSNYMIAQFDGWVAASSAGLRLSSAERNRFKLKRCCFCVDNEIMWLTIGMTIWLSVTIWLVLTIISREAKKQDDRDKFIDQIMKDRSKPHR